MSFYHRNLARQQQQVAQWLQKRRQENAQRRLAGEEPLPEEDPVLFKPPPEPSPLDGFLIVSQARSCRGNLFIALRNVGCSSCCPFILPRLQLGAHFCTGYLLPVKCDER